MDCIDNNERISFISIDENILQYDSLIRQRKLCQSDDSKCEKDDSSSDIDVIDNLDSLQSSFSSQWSVINPVVNVPIKNDDERRKSIGTQTEDLSQLFHMNTINVKCIAKIFGGLLCLFLIYYINNLKATQEKENGLLQDLSTLLKKLKIDINQMKSLQDSDKNFTSIMRDITDIKLELHGLKEHNVFRYNLLETRVNELQDHNQNLTNEVIKLRSLLKESGNCRISEENVLMLNRTIFNIIQHENNKIQEQKDEVFPQSISSNDTVKSQTNHTKENPGSGSCVVNWFFCRAHARNDQRKLKNPERWQFLRAYGRGLLRWVNKNVLQEVERILS